MIKRLTLCMLALSLGSLYPLSASGLYVTVVDKSGNETSVERSATSRIDLGNETVELIQKDGERLIFNKAAIAKILLDSETSGIDGTKTSNIYVCPLSTHDMVHVYGVSESTAYQLYDLNGQLRMSGKCQTEGTELSLGGLDDGLYLLIVGQSTFKIIKY